MANVLERQVANVIATGADRVVKGASNVAGAAELVTARADEAVNLVGQTITEKAAPDVLTLSKRTRNAIHNLADNNPNAVFVAGTAASAAATGAAIGTLVLPGPGTLAGAAIGASIGGGGGVTMASIKDLATKPYNYEWSTSHVMLDESLIGAGMTAAVSGALYFAGEHGGAMEAAQLGGIATASVAGVTGLFRYIRDFFTKA